MKKWKAYCTGLVTLASLSPTIQAQPVPAVPAAPAAAGPAAAPAFPGAGVAPAGTPGAPAPGGLASFLGITKAQKEAMRRACCQTPFGQFLNQMMAPMRVFTGGILGNFCPTTPSIADLNKPGPEGAAAAVQLDEAQAKARRAAVRYLGTVDCHFWGDAVNKPLVAALRTDKNECVRWEAAMALGGGCCCTKLTIEALLISATGSDKDGFPSETCPRVREAAMASLMHCLSCYHEEVAAPKGPTKGPEKPNTKGPEKAQLPLDPEVAEKLAAFQKSIENKSLGQTVQDARRTIGAMSASAPADQSTPPPGSRGLFNIVANALGGSRHVVASPAPSVAPEGEVVGGSKMLRLVPESQTMVNEPMPLQKNFTTPVSTQYKPVISEVKPPVSDYKPVAMPAIVTPARPLTTEVKPVAMPAVSRTSPPQAVEYKPMTPPAVVAPAPTPVPEFKPVATPVYVPAKPVTIEAKPVTTPVYAPSTPAATEIKPVFTPAPAPVKPVTSDFRPVSTPTETVVVKPAVSEFKPVATPAVVVASAPWITEVKPESMPRVTEIKPEPTPAAVTMTPAVTSTIVTPVEVQPAPVPSSMVSMQQPVVVPPQQSMSPVRQDPQAFLSVLNRSMYPFQREWAAERLAETDWQHHPEVVKALVTAARKDSAPVVRVMCVRSLARMHAATPAVIAAVQELRSDADPRVVVEADLAASVLGASQTPQAAAQAAPYGAVRPASLATPVPSGAVRPASYTVNPNNAFAQ